MQGHTQTATDQSMLDRIRECQRCHDIRMEIITIVWRWAVSMPPRVTVT